MEKQIHQLTLGPLYSWTPSEQNLLKKIVENSEVKNWRFIADRLHEEGGSCLRTFRSQNCLKNKFYGSIRKLVRKLNLVVKRNKKFKRELKYESVLRALEYESSVSTNSSNEADLNCWKFSNTSDLREIIIQAAKNGIDDLRDEAILQLIKRINSFNLVSRNHQVRRDHPRKNQLKLKKCVTLCEQAPESLQNISPFSNKILNNFEIKNEGILFKRCNLSERQLSISEGLVDMTFYEIDKCSYNDEFWPVVHDIEMSELL